MNSLMACSFASVIILFKFVLHVYLLGLPISLTEHSLPKNGLEQNRGSQIGG